MRRILLLFIVIILLSACDKPQKKFTVAFYNVENLFDTINTPEKRDGEFTPAGRLQYTSKRYQKKLKNISKVIAAIDSVYLPALVGVCEIENRAVLTSLVNQPALKRGGYGIAHIESPDRRGIDCALLYQKKHFQFLEQTAIAVNFPNDPKYKTRDILYVKGILKTDTMHIFINHWPSRIGGRERSEPNRVFTALQLRKAVTAVQNKNSRANIIIMGDFNDEPINISVAQTLQSGNKKTDDTKYLYNLTYDLKLQNKGSYNYKGRWNMLDNIIVSNELILDKKSLHTSHNSCSVFQPEWICYRKRNNKYVPNRTYAGKKYYGGYSDHFPVYFTLTK